MTYINITLTVSKSGQKYVDKKEEGGKKKKKEKKGTMIKTFTLNEIVIKMIMKAVSYTHLTLPTMAVV